MNAKPATEKQINYINDLMAKQINMLSKSEFQADYALMQRVGARKDISTDEASQLIDALKDVSFAVKFSQFLSDRAAGKFIITEVMVKRANRMLKEKEIDEMSWQYQWIVRGVGAEFVPGHLRVYLAIEVAPETTPEPTSNETSDNDYWFAQDDNSYPREMTIIEIKVTNTADEKIAVAAKSTVQEIINMIQREQSRTWIDMHTTAVFFAFPVLLKTLLNILDKYTLPAHDYVLPDAVTELQALIPQFTVANVVHMAF